MYTMGIDIGSTATKGVILKDGKEIIAYSTISSGTGTSGPKRVQEDLKEKSNLGIEDMSRIIATGYGRMNFEKADKQISELSCHAKGVSFLVPTARTVIDIGGQDAKALRLTEDGRLDNFVMNDKCAAGTGRFLDVMAGILETDISNLGDISSKSTKDIKISSTCTVFAESEVISYLSTGAKIEDIVNGIHNSVAGRVASLAKRVGIKDDIVMVGGVARNKGVVRSMEKALGKTIVVPQWEQLTGALGASLYAYEELLESENK